MELVQELLPKLRDTSPDSVVGGLYDVTGLEILDVEYKWYKRF